MEPRKIKITVGTHSRSKGGYRAEARFGVTRCIGVGVGNNEKEAITDLLIGLEITKDRIAEFTIRMKQLLSDDSTNWSDYSINGTKN